MKGIDIHIVAEDSKRLRYVCDFIFPQSSGLKYEIIRPDDHDKEIQTALIYYNSGFCKESFGILPTGVLTDGAPTPVPENTVIENMPVLYPDKNTATGFDVFSAVFYLLSRAEEYGAETLDNHERFLPEHSILFTMNCLQQPIVEIWLQYFFDKLNAFFPDLKPVDRKFRFIPTIDIDNAYAVKHKGFFRSCAAIGKALVSGDFLGLKERFSILSGKSNDPYDTYNFIDACDKKYGIRTRFFWLLGNYNRYDTNLPVRKKAFRKLIHRSTEKHPFGIHPSYASNRKHKLLEIEKKRLECITEQKVDLSRQHFLKLNIPDTFRKLTNAGIREDYSLGYASVTGFRAGTCQPFYFYDLEKEMQSNLLLYSFPVMEVTLRQYLSLSPEEAEALYRGIVTEVKKHKGTFVSLWHNESLSDTGKWKGWRKVYTSMIQLTS